MLDRHPHRLTHGYRMDESSHDERMRRLQRLAYGAVASDADRAAAIAELEALRREQAERERTDPVGAPTTRASPRAAEAGPSTQRDSVASDAPASKRATWAITAGVAAALLVGIAVGWQLGVRTAAVEPSTTGPSAAPASDASMIPIGDTAVPGLFEADPSPGDMPPAAYPRDPVAPTEYRLLLIRPDGVSLRVSRLHGGADVCTVVTLPNEFTASSCTHDGMFPRSGLWVDAYLPGGWDTIRGTIHADGRAELSPRHPEPGARPIVTG
jgi:hypothetical protein